MEAHVVTAIMFRRLGHRHLLLGEVEGNFPFDRLLGSEDALLLDLLNLSLFGLEAFIRLLEIDVEFFLLALQEEAPTSQKIGFGVELEAEVFIHLLLLETLDVDVPALHLEAELLLALEIVSGQKVPLVRVDIAETDKTEEPSAGVGQKDAVVGKVGCSGQGIDDTGEGDDLLVFEAAVQLEVRIGRSGVRNGGMTPLEIVAVVFCSGWGCRRVSIRYPRDLRSSRVSQILRRFEKTNSPS